MGFHGNQSTETCGVFLISITDDVTGAVNSGVTSGKKYTYLQNVPFEIKVRGYNGDTGCCSSLAAMWGMGGVSQSLISMWGGGASGATAEVRGQRLSLGLSGGHRCFLRGMRLVRVWGDTQDPGLWLTNHKVPIFQLKAGWHAPFLLLNP